MKDLHNPLRNKPYSLFNPLRWSSVSYEPAFAPRLSSQDADVRQYLGQCCVPPWLTSPAGTLRLDSDVH